MLSCGVLPLTIRGIGDYKFSETEEKQLESVSYPAVSEEEKIDGKMVSDVQALCRIWGKTMSEFFIGPVWNDSNLYPTRMRTQMELREQMIERTWEIAELLGIKAMIEQYQQGVPIDDILV